MRRAILVAVASFLWAKANADGTKDVCFEGYVMDRFCINRKTFLDAPDTKTLLNPEKHSSHCFLDVKQCTDSGFEILAPLAEDKKTADAAYCPAYRLGKAGDAGFDKAIALARKEGNKAGGCTTCTGTKTDKGFKALFVGKVKEADLAKYSADAPPMLTVTDVLTAGSKCPGDMTITKPPCGVIPKKADTVMSSGLVASLCTFVGAAALILM